MQVPPPEVQASAVHPEAAQVVPPLVSYKTDCHVAVALLSLILTTRDLKHESFIVISVQASAPAVHAGNEIENRLYAIFEMLAPPPEAVAV
jgi:hypothetical protein